MQAQSGVDAAQGAQARQTAIQQSALNANAAQSGLDLDKATRNAEMADFLSKNGSDMILSGGSKTQKQAIIASAARAKQEREQAGAGERLGCRIAAAKGVPQDYLEQAAKGQGVVSQAAKTGLEQAQGQQNLQKGQVETQQAKIQLGIQQHMADLQQRAAGSGPDAKSAQDSLAVIMKAQQGKGGPLTDEDLLKVYGDMVNRAVAISGPGAISDLPSYGKWVTAIKSGGAGAPQAGQLVRGKPGTPNAGKQGYIVNGQFVPAQ